MRVLSKKVLEVDGKQHPIPKGAIGFYVMGHKGTDSQRGRWFSNLRFLRMSSTGSIDRSGDRLFWQSAAFSPVPHLVHGYKSITLLSELEQVEERTYKAGDRCLIDGLEHIVAHFSRSAVSLINIQTGDRHKNPMIVGDCNCINQREMDIMTGNNKVTWLE